MIQMAAGGGIGGKVNLKASVEEETVHFIGACPTTDAVRRLEHGDFGPALIQYLCTCEAGKAGPDDDHSHTSEEFSA